MKRLPLFVYVVALLLGATPLYAQQSELSSQQLQRYPLATNGLIRIWEPNGNFTRLVTREIARRIGSESTLMNENNVKSIIGSAWVDQVGDVTVLYSPAYQLFIFIEYESDLSTNAKYIRVATRKEALEFLNPTNVVKRSELALLGRFVDGIALVTLWKAMNKDGISPLPSFLEYYHGFIDVSAPARVQDFTDSVLTVWEGLARSDAYACFDRFIDGVAASKSGDVFSPFVELGVPMRIIDYIKADNDNNIMVLADTWFARVHAFLFVDKDCKFNYAQIRAIQ